jgi:hypothetical protein
MSAIEPVDVIPPRAKLTKAQRVWIFDAEKGLCHLCGLPIKHGEPWHAEHPKARAVGGKDSYKDLKPAHIDCHKPKTREDVAVIGKIKRTRAAHLGIKRVGPDRPIVSVPMPTTQRAADRAARGHKEPLPPRQMFVDTQ